MSFRSRRSSCVVLLGPMIASVKAASTPNQLLHKSTPTSGQQSLPKLEAAEPRHDCSPGSVVKHLRAETGHGCAGFRMLSQCHR